MYPLNVTKKTGFKNLTPKEFTIFDSNGVIFYSNKNLVKKDISFNLPKGVYVSDTQFEVLKKPVLTPKINLPKPERKISTKGFKILYAENPNKATINYALKTITFDKSFLHKSKPERVFVLLHEKGHGYYGTEKYADLYAAKKMLSLGYNISQIGLSQDNVLSDRSSSIDRKNFIVNNLIPE